MAVGGVEGASYREDIVFPCRERLPGGHTASSGFDEELPVFVAILDAVGNLSVCASILIRGKHPVHRLSLKRPAPCRQLDPVDLLQELRSVVILIQHIHNHPDAYRLSRSATLSDGDLKRAKDVGGPSQKTSLRELVHLATKEKKHFRNVCQKHKRNGK